jgi:transposase-like protein
MCPVCQDPNSNVVKAGFYHPQAGRYARVQRFRCLSCRRRFSRQTGTLTFRERKSHVTHALLRLLAAGVSQRECARTLSVQPKTVARKLMRLGSRAGAQLGQFAAAFARAQTLYFDEMETFEHTKCKPVAIALAVTHDRYVVAVEAASMPAKGRLVAISHKRYGPRRDDRRYALRRILTRAATCRNAREILSDKCPRYPALVRTILPTLRHTRFKGRRACVVGQGELKAGGRDPLFSLNHTCAMFRDHLKRLSRRTWCTTKRIDRLQLLLNLYAWCHNFRRTWPKARLSLDPPK